MGRKRILTLAEGLRVASQLIDCAMTIYECTTMEWRRNGIFCQRGVSDIFTALCAHFGSISLAFLFQASRSRNPFYLCNNFHFLLVAFFVIVFINIFHRRVIPLGGGGFWSLNF